ncbi:diguanylate cyclase domain-containing protein [Pseudoalteromonas xiamenensis]|uniref:sensor domain-containing protein n=1 Tax=Pseudoalteromonas xiamenensis TaxID=882626 RepID=UPI0035EF355B
MFSTNSQLSSESLYRLFEITPVPVVLSYPDGQLEYANPAMKNLLGYPGDEMFDRDVIITHEDDVALNNTLRRQLDKSPLEAVQLNKRYRHKNGHVIYAQLNVIAQPDNQGNIVRYISQIIDLTSEKKTDAAEIVLNLFFEKSKDAVYIVEPSTGHILFANRSAYEKLGYTKEELLQKTVPDINPTYHSSGKWQNKVETLKKQDAQVYESVLLQKDGNIIPTEVSVSYAEVNGRDYLLSIVRDITQRKALEQQKEVLVNTDPLTGLFNRRFLVHKLEALFDDVTSPNELIGFIYVDLDNFKYINDNFGHVSGDKVLIEVSSRLSAVTRNTDLVARLGGDEFLVVLTNLSDKNDIQKIAEKIASEVTKPIGSLTIEASFGVAVSPTDGNEPTELIANADRAMYQAKKEKGLSICYFSKPE